MTGSGTILLSLKQPYFCAIFVHIFIILISQIRKKPPAQGTQEVAELRLKSSSAQFLASSSV